MYSPYDLERVGGENQTLEMMRAAGIQVRMETYNAEGHTFPEEFADLFHHAVEFLMEP